jgi:NADPH:quinone reductase-like Zn-dependent oxidoreductase
VKAVVIVPSNGDMTFQVREIPPPVAGPDDLLVAVKAAGLNRANLIRNYPVRTSRADGVMVAGGELAGEVIAVGSKATEFRIGDRVMGMAEGAFAEQAIVDHRLAMRVPAGMGWAEAGATPIVYCTAHDALLTNGELAPGETVLVNAASSGVGVAAIQIAKLKGAGLVVGTSGSAAKLARVREIGADLVIDYRQENFADAILAKTNKHGADVILDNVGRSMLADNIKVAAIKARMISVGRLGGNVDALDLDELARKRIRLIGVTFRTRSLDERIAVVRRFVDDCLGAVAKRQLWPIIDRTFPLDAVDQAMAHMRANAHFGKLALTT